MKKILFLSFIFLSFCGLKAQEGFLDPSFGNNGYTTVNTSIFSTAFQSDGKLVGILSGSQPATTFTIHRYGTSGTLDATFGSGGVVNSNFSPQYTSLRPWDVGIQPDGKIIVAVVGTRVQFFQTLNVYGFVRYNPDGTLDPSFGNNGVADRSYPVGGGFSVLGFQQMGVQLDGKILIALTASRPGGTSLRVERYNANGTQDVDFSLPGFSPSSFGLGNFSLFRSFPSVLLPQSDGKVVLAGTTGAGTFSELTFLVRFNPNGRPDSSFGVNGHVLTRLTHSVRDAAIQSDKKIVLAGAEDINGSFGTLLYRTEKLVRFNADGTIDPTFGSGGVLLPPFTVHQVLIQNDTKILAAGALNATGANGHFLLARYNTNGNFDPGFGYGGMMATALHPNSISVQDMTIAANRLYVYGSGYLTAYQLNASMLQEGNLATQRSNGLLLQRVLPEKLQIVAAPNPAVNHFTLRIDGSNGREPVQVRIIDALGRTVEWRRNVAANSTLQLGSEYNAGLYYAEIIQGTERKTIKLIKGAGR